MSSTHMCTQSLPQWIAFCACHVACCCSRFLFGYLTSTFLFLVLSLNPEKSWTQYSRGLQCLPANAHLTTVSKVQNSFAINTNQDCLHPQSLLCCYIHRYSKTTIKMFQCLVAPCFALFITILYLTDWHIYSPSHLPLPQHYSTVCDLFLDEWVNIECLWGNNMFELMSSDCRTKVV